MILGIIWFSGEFGEWMGDQSSPTKTKGRLQKFNCKLKRGGIIRIFIAPTPFLSFFLTIVHPLDKL